MPSNPSIGRSATGMPISATHVKRSLRFGMAIMPSLMVLESLLSGCVGAGCSELPPQLSEIEAHIAEGPALGLSVGVERYRWPAYSDSLLKALRFSAVFCRVAPLDEFTQPPDLIARVQEEIYGTAVFPILTLISFGLIPHTSEEAHGESFSLTPPSGSNDGCDIRYVYRGETTLGWWALLKSIHPDFTRSDPERSERYRLRLRYELLRRREALLAIAAGRVDDGD